MGSEALKVRWEHAVARFLRWANKHEKAGPAAAFAIWVAYVVFLNRPLGIGSRTVDADAWYARAHLGLQQHFAQTLASDTTACGLLVDEISSQPVRTGVGITCWRCALLRRIGSKEEETNHG